MTTSGDDQRIVEALGAAVIRIWSGLPREIQETLFETAVSLGPAGEQDESLREQMAKFLHDHHPRTTHPDRPEFTTPSS